MVPPAPILAWTFPPKLAGAVSYTAAPVFGWGRSAAVAGRTIKSAGGRTGFSVGMRLSAGGSGVRSTMATSRCGIHEPRMGRHKSRNSPHAVGGQNHIHGRNRAPDEDYQARCPRQGSKHRAGSPESDLARHDKGPPPCPRAARRGDNPGSAFRAEVFRRVCVRAYPSRKNVPVAAW